MPRVNTSSSRAVCAALLLGLNALIASTAPAYAQSAEEAPDKLAEDKAAAESLFQAARQLMEEARYAEACPKFVESQRLDPTLGTLLNLARCHQLEGKTATAWAEYNEVARRASQADQAERAEVAQGFADELEPKLSRLRITVAAAPPPDFTLTRNGVVLSEASIGVELPIDPGPQQIEATAPGYEAWSKELQLQPDGDRQTVIVPALAKLPPPPIEPAPLVPPSPSDAPADSTPSKDEFDWTTTGFIVGGVGIASIVVGAVFGGVAASEISDAESDPSLCPNQKCSDAGLAQVDAAETKAWVANIAIGLGVLAVGGGALMIALDPSDPQSGATVGLRGTW